MNRRLRHPLLLGLGLVVCAGAAGATWWGVTYYPRRFATVEPGRLYRSGEVSPAQLTRLKEHGVQRVISLLAGDVPESQAEQKRAVELGLEWHNVPMRGNGESTPEARDRLRALLTAPGAPPTLVHCAAGVNRTGLAVGMYRLHVQGWTLEQVMAELRSTDFEDLPKHENLRQALAEEARLAAAARG